MKLVADSGKKVIFLAWIFFIFYSLFFSFSYVLFTVVVFLHLVFKRSEREVHDDEENFILSPIDAHVLAIKVDEENRRIKIILKKTYFGIFFESSELRIPVKCENINFKRLNGVKYSENYFSNASVFDFGNIELLIKPGRFAIHNTSVKKTLKKGSRVGILTNGLIELSLPYESRILVGLDDRILANSTIAVIGD